jgi:hypothetical protein
LDLCSLSPDRLPLLMGANLNCNGEDKRWPQHLQEKVLCYISSWQWTHLNRVEKGSLSFVFLLGLSLMLVAECFLPGVFLMLRTRCFLQVEYMIVVTDMNSGPF